ncbi:MAG: DEAD/DEAH box helicase [Magnetococcales bacterium]|nr:DEAD/DEAH box helicase [Magnetococcales bacterium]
MQLTDYHSKYYAYDLTRSHASDSEERLAVAVAGAQVDLNPHQVDAALFAFKSPFSKGALLADEVGLGKTIEAGLVLSQYWAERKRRILIITPSNLRKQWNQELKDKFFLESVILESKNYHSSVKHGNHSPFERKNEIVICSFQFASNKKEDLGQVPWDLVVIDEAHRLRNVYKPSNIIANTLRDALKGRNKVLLTATPLQNSLLELYGLVTFIDEHAFGDIKSFREQYSKLNEEAYDHLKQRLKTLCYRTLRRQVTAYVKFTARLPILEEFTPKTDEDRLYKLVSEYLQRENLRALPSSQRTLMTLMLRKLLASSTFAIAGALTTMANRLKSKLETDASDDIRAIDLGADYDAFANTADEWEADEAHESLSPSDRDDIESEIRDLESFAALANAITSNAKGTKLIGALDVAFDKARQLGAAEKAIIFTESRKTQDYLVRLLSASRHAEGIVLFNGSNNDQRSKEIYQAWMQRHKETERVTGSPSADMRSALVDFFREQGRIMIATEAGAEGINLQFCSLLVNYDLPWNPQRVEQRIGRVHRYGQKHDVVVVNFLNKNNEADKRVYQLLDQKFKLFEGVFGASDEVLGAIESGVDLEKRIAEIYQRCRRPEEIQRAFDQLQQDLDSEINEEMTRTHMQLLEHFDDEVREKLRSRKNVSEIYLKEFEKRLMNLTRHELNGHAQFVSGTGFDLISHPFASDGIPLGRYELPRHSSEAHLYRLDHPLADAVLRRAIDRTLPAATIVFDLKGHEGKVTVLENLPKSGWLMLSQLTINALDQVEDRLIFAMLADDGTQLTDGDVPQRLLTVSGEVQGIVTPPREVLTTLEQMIQRDKNGIIHNVSERNKSYFQEEEGKLDRWADDQKSGLEREIKEIDRQIIELRRAAMIAVTLEEKLAGQKKVRAMENTRKQKRHSLFDAQDAVDEQRSKLIEAIYGKLKHKDILVQLFVIQWSIA